MKTHTPDLLDHMVRLSSGKFFRPALKDLVPNIDPRSGMFVIERGTATINPQAKRVLKTWGKVGR